ncbi:MAG: phenylacetate--CoA ligase family protein [Phycisphaerae bacterium]
MILDPSLECLSRADRHRLQSERLATLVQRVHARVPFYRRALDAADIPPESIRDVSDLPRLPTTVKGDLRDEYPFGMFAVPIGEVIRVHASSGTTGRPTVAGYTRADIDTWAQLCARCLAAAGAQPGQMLQNAYGYGLFTGGLGMHYGAERLGMTVIPVSGGNTARQIRLLHDFRAVVMTCTPSYALTLADALATQGVERGALALRTFVLGAEPWTEPMRREIESRVGVDALNIYGLSEVIGPGVSGECVEAKAGSHIFEDHFIVEVLHPETHAPLPDGTIGELTFTTLTKEAMPLLRYRTGDLASVTHEPCRCGRTHARMSRIVGRVDDMLIIRGVNVYPSQIEEALLGAADVSAHHLIRVQRRGRLDALAIEVEAADPLYDRAGADVFSRHAEAGVEDLRRIEGDVQQRIFGLLNLNVDVTLVPPGTLPRSEGGKLSRVVDERGREGVPPPDETQRPSGRGSV